jgi:hypothetical protein
MASVSRLFKTCSRSLAEEAENLRGCRAEIRKDRKAREKVPYVSNQALSIESQVSDDSAWEIHELAFSAFLDAPPAVLTIENVPFPPFEQDAFRYLIKTYKGLTRKDVFKIACQRWHPDKFMQKFGNTIETSEKEKIQSKLNSIFQAINSSYAKSIHPKRVK